MTKLKQIQTTADMLTSLARTLDTIGAIAERPDPERAVTTQRLRRFESECARHTEGIVAIKAKLEAM